MAKDTLPLVKVTHSEQPAELRSLLERNVRMWAVVVQKVIPRTRLPLRELADQLFGRAGEMWLSDAHFLAIGLRQIEQHLQRLKRIETGFRTREIATAAQHFLDAYRHADVNNLRHVLEHQADYLAGDGRKPDLVVDLKESVSFGTDDLSGPEESVYVSIFGKPYRVDPIVRAAAALEAALREAGAGAR